MKTKTPDWIKQTYMERCTWCNAWYLKGLTRPYLNPITYRWFHKIEVGPPVKCLADSLRRTYLRNRRARAAGRAKALKAYRKS